jgi:hypothetical protein
MIEIPSIFFPLKKLKSLQQHISSLAEIRMMTVTKMTALPRDRRHHDQIPHRMKISLQMM